MNRSVYKEVVRPERLVFARGGGDEDKTGMSFVATVTFEEAGDGKTKGIMRSVFPSAGMRQMVVRQVDAAEGGRLSPERLEEHLGARQA